MKNRIVKAALSMTLVASMGVTCTMPSLAASTDPNSSAQREMKNAEISQHAAEEGMVILDNSTGTLPIEKTGNIALYGAGVYATVKGGTGSGNVNVKEGAIIDVQQGFEEAGYTIVNKDFIESQEKNYRDSESLDEPAYEKTDVTTAANEAETAIYVLARNSGEGKDRSSVKGDYYLTDNEKVNLALLGETFDKVIVVLNVGGIIDTNFYHGKGSHGNDDELNREQIEGLDALVLMSQAGQNGGRALVNVLNGTVNPSGKLADTWAIDYTDYPSSASFSSQDGVTLEELYTEDIYVGYRYFDTFGKDVAYEFGFGDSYTDFAIDVKSVTADEKTVTVTADVTNKGDMDGKEVVEVYFSAPVYDEKKDNLAKPYQELAGYQKVAVQAGATETVTVTFDTADMSSYDEAKDVYVLEDGDYTIRVGNSSRNTIEAATITLDEDVIIEQCRNNLGLTKEQMKEGTYTDGIVQNNTYVDGTNKFGKPAKVGIPAYGQIPIEGILDESSEGYGKGIEPANDGLTAENTSITLDSQKFPAADTHIYSNGEVVTYVSSDASKDSAKYAEAKAAKAGETRTTVEAAVGATLVDVVDGKISMEQLVADMSNEELAYLVEGDTISRREKVDESVIDNQSDAIPGAAGETTRKLIDSRCIPNIVMANGPAGVKLTVSYTEDDVTYYQYCTAMPIGTLMAQTWDPDLVEEVGRAMGVEMLEYGATFWLAPGMNIHRNPLCGRNFEYYSEDPLLCGLTAAAATNGVQTNEDGSDSGVGVTVKHFAFNNQENDRDCGNSVVSERAAREIYLKGFEIAVKTSNPETVMSSYNMVNGYPTFEHYGLLTEILRNEWGFKGFVMTDWYAQGYVLGKNQGKNVQGMMQAAGNNLDMPIENADSLLTALDENEIMCLGDLQRSAINMLNVFKESAVFKAIYSK